MQPQGNNKINLIIYRYRKAVVGVDLIKPIKPGVEIDPILDQTPNPI
jgi:hypothetical protein